MPSFPTVLIAFKTWNMCNIKTLTWLGIIKKFPRKPVAAETFETRGRNNILLRYHYRFDPELGKGVCEIHWIPCAHPACVAQLDKYWLPTISPSYQPKYAHVKNIYYNKILEHYNDWIIMVFLDNKTLQVEFDNSRELVPSWVSTKKAELVKLNGCGAIAVNY